MNASGKTTIVGTQNARSSVIAGDGGSGTRLILTGGTIFDFFDSDAKMTDMA